MGGAVQRTTTMTAVPAFDYVPCDACVCGAPLRPGTRVVEKHFAWGAVRFVACANCGTLVQSPRIATASVAAWYDSEQYQQARSGEEGPYLDYLAEEAGRRLEARARYQRDLLALLPRRGRVLEVGCATGSLLAVLRDAGHEVVGVELSSSFAGHAKRLNDLDVEVVDFAAYAGEEASFDLVLMLGTVSNLAAPVEQFAHARRLLRPGGTFYCNLPVADAWPARLYGAHYWMFAPSVCNFMTTAGVRAALGRAGFATVESTTDVQRPTLAKLAGHLKLHRLYPVLRRAGLAQGQLPFSLPVPGVRSVRARVA